MVRLNAILIAATTAAVLFAASTADAAGHGGRSSGGGLPAGSVPPLYGSVWAAEQRKAHNPSASKSDSTQSKTGQTVAPAGNGR